MTDRRGYDMASLYKDLFDTMDDVRRGRLGTDKAKVIQELGQTIVNLGTLEHRHRDAFDANVGTKFFPDRSLPQTQGQTEERKWPKLLGKDRGD